MVKRSPRTLRPWYTGLRMEDRDSAHSASATASLATGEWPVYGHRWAVGVLGQSLRRAGGGEGAARSYLVTGPRQVGKSTLVRAYAQTLFCTSHVKPCGRCRSCQLIQRGAHPDFHVVSPLSRQSADAAEVEEKSTPDRVAGKLVFAQARAVVRDANVRPVESNSKVILIQDAHRAADARFMNLLLKTLEEPPAHVTLFVTATDASAVLPTVVSRCQIIPLQLVDLETVRQALISHWGVDPGHADLMARLAGGRLGWAVERSQRSGLWQERQTRLEQLWAIAASSRLERLVLAETMSSRNAQLFDTLELWQTWWRDVLLVQSGCDDFCVNVDCRDRLEGMAHEAEPAAVREFLLSVQRIEAGLRRSVMPRLALDVLLLKMPHVGETAHA